jgi:L-aminopeptidase/D-esterase-like protein
LPWDKGAQNPALIDTLKEREDINALLTPILSTTNHTTATSIDSTAFETQRALAVAILSSQ